MKKNTIALFGGSFDPIHVGHTTVAVHAAERLNAQKTIFIPARRSPLKHARPRATDEDRLAMIECATANNGSFSVSDYELKRPAPSYTLHTVNHFREISPANTSIYWLMGADSVKDLPYWYGISELIRVCDLAVMYRAGFDPPDFSAFAPLWGEDQSALLQQNVVKTPLVDASSTEIRARLAQGNSVHGLLEPAVLAYIQEKRLYGVEK
jgi:nicotinate-nucleotide adenylyltransferase